MKFCVRPSKTYLFEILERTLAHAKGQIGLDAGSTDMKNRSMFKTDKYVGLDIDLEGLKRGLDKFRNDPTTLALHTDLTKMQKLPSGSVQACVSTNTLFRIPMPQMTQAISELCRITSPDGVLLFEIDSDIDLTKKITSDNFGSVRVVYFRNLLSRAYENFFEKDGFLGQHPIAGSKPFLLISWLISRLEYLTSSFKKPRAMFICTKKKNQMTEAFDFNRFTRIDERLYTTGD